MQLIILLTLFGLLLALRLLRTLRSPRLPPGPQGRPILGLLGMLPTKRPWEFFNSLGNVHGAICCIHILGRPIILLNSFEAIDELFNKRSSKYAMKPRRRMAEFVGYTATLPFMNPGPRFTKARKLFHSELSAVPMQRHYGAQEQAAQNLLRLINEDEKNLEDHLKGTLGGLALWVSCGHAVQSRNDPLIRLAEDIATNAASVLGGSYNFVDQFSILCHFPSWFPGVRFKKTAQKWRTQLLQLCERSYNVAKTDVEGGRYNPSFMASVLSGLSERPEPEDDGILRFTTITMHAGGLETIHSVLLSFFLAMTLYPQVQRTAQEEIDTIVGKDRLPTMADRDSLKYVRCLMQEILRWNPVAPLIARQAGQDDEYQGYFIPKGTTVVANVWTLTQNADVFPNPQVFRPERFVEQHKDDKEKDPHYFTFGFGRRICPGINFADPYLFIVIARLLAVFDISKAVNSNGEVITPKVQYTTSAASRPMPFECNIKPRSEQAILLIQSQ